MFESLDRRIMQRRRRDIAADQRLQDYALFEQRLFQLERLDLLSEESGVEVNIAPLVEIARRVGSVRDFRSIAQSANVARLAWYWASMRFSSVIKRSAAP
jgi:hypothetical protein